MSKYAVARQGLADAVANGQTQGTEAADVLEAMIVLAVADLAKLVGGKRTADVLRYELQNVGGDVDTVFLRSR